jgi:hypothetical protein
MEPVERQQFLLLRVPATGLMRMRNFCSATATVLVTLGLWIATANPLQADTGTVHVLFSKAGVLVAVGSGQGTLTFHGKKYPFEVSGASFGATLALTVNEFVGDALNLQDPNDLAGTYTVAGAGAALVFGAGAVRLRNANGVILVLHGPSLGVELSTSLARVTVTMR